MCPLLGIAIHFFSLNAHYSQTRVYWLCPLNVKLTRNICMETGKGFVVVIAAVAEEWECCTKYGKIWN